MKDPKITLDNNSMTATIDKKSFNAAVQQALMTQLTKPVIENHPNFPDIPVILRSPLTQMIIHLINTDQSIQNTIRDVTESVISDMIEDQSILPGKNYG